MKTKDMNKTITEILSMILFLAPLLIFPRKILEDYNIPKVIVLYSCGLGLLIILFTKIKEIKFDKKDICIFGFWILAGISTIFSINHKVALLGTYGRYEGFLMITVYILAYYFSKYYFKKYKYFFNILFGIVTIICISAILEFYNLNPIENIFKIKYQPYWTSATFGHRNFLANYITIFLPIFMCLFIIKGKKRFFIISLIVFWAMLATTTRSAYVAFAIYSFIGIIYLIYKKDKTKFKKAIILSISFILIFIIANGLSNDRIIGKVDLIITELKNEAQINIKAMKENTLQEKENKTQEVKENQNKVITTTGIMKDQRGSGRLEIWQVTLNEIKLHPLIGTGPDTLEYAIAKDQPEYYFRRLIQTGTYIDKAHNEFLQIAATIGIPAMVLYLIFLIMIFKDNIGKMFKDDLTLIMLLSIIGYLVQACFNISTIGVAPVFWIMLGLIQNEEFMKKQ